MSNFTFLKERWPILENLGRLAERNLYIDSNTTLRKEYKKLTFGEPMLVDTISNSNFIGDWNWLVDYFIDD